MCTGNRSTATSLSSAPDSPASAPAYRIREKNPHLSYTVLERRERLGGTWDLFRYPGIRSDSDIFTLCFPWEPWTRPEMIADGDDIWNYIADTARKHGIDEHIRFNTYVRSADWDPATDIWTVQTEHRRRPKTYRSRFVFFGTGYYNYDEPYAPTFPGIEDFTGDVVHPQHWPDGFDYTGKRLVVIGSGATAVSMIPSLTEKAAHVTMLQRTPSLHDLHNEGGADGQRDPEGVAAAGCPLDRPVAQRAPWQRLVVHRAQGAGVQQAQAPQHRGAQPA